MSSAILFRFHKNLALCRNRLRHLRRLNPGVPIYGLYGGDSHFAGVANATLGGLLEHMHSLAGGRAFWKWADFDRAVASWFRDAGQELPFERLHMVEWDMILLDSVDALYRSVPADAVGLTALTPLLEVEQRWTWMQQAGYRAEAEELFRWARDEHGWQANPYTCLAWGASLPRRFLEDGQRLALPALGHDELRLPLAAQLLGYQLYDTGFHCKTESADLEIEQAVIDAELAKPAGRRVFHPYRRPYLTHARPVERLEALTARATGAARASVLAARQAAKRSGPTAIAEGERPSRMHEARRSMTARSKAAGSSMLTAGMKFIRSRL
jgi:hypothetical protein